MDYAHTLHASHSHGTRRQPSAASPSPEPGTPPQPQPLTLPAPRPVPPPSHPHPATRSSSPRLLACLFALLACILLRQARLPAARVLWVRVAHGALHHLDGRQQRVQPARHDGLGSAAPPGNGNAAERSVDGAQQQRLHASSVRHAAARAVAWRSLHCSDWPLPCPQSHCRRVLRAAARGYAVMMHACKCICSVRHVQSRHPRHARKLEQWKNFNVLMFGSRIKVPLEFCQKAIFPKAAETRGIHARRPSPFNPINRIACKVRDDLHTQPATGPHPPASPA